MSTNNTKFKVGDHVVVSILQCGPQWSNHHGTISRIRLDEGYRPVEISFDNQDNSQFRFAAYWFDELEPCDDFDCWAKRVRQEHASKGR